MTACYIILKYMLTNTVVSFKMAKHGSISFTCVEFVPLTARLCREWSIWMLMLS